MQLTLPWMIALASVAVLALASVWFARKRKPLQPKPLPSEWTLTARPVFSTDERRVYRQLREALPHHTVLSKLPLVRFCQPTDPQQVRYWYELLGSVHVTFAICSTNGRVLAAIDLDTDRGNSRRMVQIKQSVLGACRVRYLRCPVDHLPSIPELQLLVPHTMITRGPQPAPTFDEARDSLAKAVESGRKERTTLWRDSSFFHDSFFTPDNRSDASSQFGGLDSGRQAARERPADGDDITGLVIHPPRYSTPSRH